MNVVGALLNLPAGGKKRSRDAEESVLKLSVGLFERNGRYYK